MIFRNFFYNMITNFDDDNFLTGMNCEKTKKGYFNEIHKLIYPFPFLIHI